MTHQWQNTPGGGEEICVSGGLTEESLGCVNNDNGDSEENTFEADMLLTKVVLIEFTRTIWGTVRELEIDYLGE